MAPDLTQLDARNKLSRNSIVVRDRLLRPRIGSDRNDFVRCELLRSPINLLFAPCRPSAITRFVPAIIFDAIKGQPDRALPHIGQEVLERSPPFADRDAAATVILEISAGRVVAPSKHVRPRSVSFRRAMLCVAVLPHSIPCFLRLETTARTGVARTKHRSFNRIFVPAIAFAKPTGAPSFPDDPQSDQPSEALACDILDGGHRDYSSRGQVTAWALARPGRCAL